MYGCMRVLHLEMRLQKSRNIHIEFNAALYNSSLLPPPTSLPPGAPRQRAEWSRAVCGDSDIHRMQWIINEHHLVHTTGEHSSNRLLQDVSPSFSRFFRRLPPSLPLYLISFPQILAATQKPSRFPSSSRLFFLRLHLLCPVPPWHRRSPPSQRSSVASLTA